MILQRCTVHIQRECKTWLTAHPKGEAGLSWLHITNKLSQATTHHKAQLWIKDLLNWHQQYQFYIAEKSVSKTGRYWYKHKMVRRSFVMIRNALPNMFKYLFNSRVPKSTNGLESFFGHLKSYLLLHRGLAKNICKVLLSGICFSKIRNRFLSHGRIPMKNREPKLPVHCISVNFITNRLLLSRDYFLFRFTLLIKSFFF